MEQPDFTAAEQQQFDQAMAAYNQDDMATAAPLLEALYQSHPSAELGLATTAAMYATGDMQPTLAIMEDFLDDYLKNETTFLLAVNLYLANNLPIDARQLVMGLSEHVDWQVEALQAIDEAEAKLTADDNLMASFNLSHFYHLGEGSFAEQRERLMEGKSLPLVSFVAGARQLLTDPFVKPLIKSAIVDELRKLKVEDRFDMLWLDDTIKVFEPAKLVPMFETKSLNDVTTALDVVMTNQDPITDNLLTRQIFLQETLLYPFADTIITQPTTWVQVALAVLKDESVADFDPEIVKNLTWVNEMTEHLQAGM